ncbi:hypothetical protein HII13_001494 [Brettanomyces bruxellensis]|uniref:DEBR0S3_15236g1_1 n=1 Tax=Dekkera bruxellensis TaxID=5007 RepID=A0A7D9H203_DEKBR|nr:hypothetical protein HII13_001494 [Brettanomyces bruxellensis]VUG18588.1 DEBR0S3_15236g1_1 [Brettanomyces bruxellensis]
MVEPDSPRRDRCEILGPFSLLIQGCLGILALSSLVWKRFHEYPNRRPWRVWFFDVSKQVLGALGVHLLNIGMSILGGNSDEWFKENGDPNNQTTSPYYLQYKQGRPKPSDLCDNPCDYYFLNILFDTTVGIPILWGLLYAIYHLAKKSGISGIDSGEYGNPPRFDYYSKQLGLYFLGLLSMKLIIYTLLVLCPFLVRFAVWILSWSDSIPELQVAFVMMIFPLIMNSFQYYVIDNIIQSPEYYKMNKKLKHRVVISSSSNTDEEQSSISEQSSEIHGLLGQPKPRLSEANSVDKS